MRALNRSVEETRMGLMTQIDFLEELKVQLEFNRAGGQISELLKRGEANINGIQVIGRTRSNLQMTLPGSAGRPLQPASPRIGQTLRRRQQRPLQWQKLLQTLRSQ
jgi:hypothetical protein